MTSRVGIRSLKWLERHGESCCSAGLWITVLLACGLLVSKNEADPDLWGHVQYGRDLLEYGLPATSTYTYTAPGHPWVNHELLSELLLASLVDTVGARSLLFLKLAIGVGILAMAIRRAHQRQVSPLVTAGWTLLAALNLVHFWSVRPQVFSFGLLALMLAVCDRALGPWESGQGPANRRPLPEGVPPVRIGWLWVLPPLVGVWANTHGAFVAGLALLGVYLAGRSVELWLAYGRGARRWVAHLAGAYLASVAATLVNPYGWQLHRWLLRSLSVPRPEIIEWIPPELLSIVWLPFWTLLGIGVLAAVRSTAPRDWTQLAVLAITAWQACEHRRHIPLLAILAVWWLPVHLEALRQAFLHSPAAEQARQRRRTRDVRTSSARFALPAGTLAALSVVAAMILGTLADQLRMIRVPRDGYPVAALQYMAQEGLDGNLVVRFKWAQYALAAGGARSSGDRGWRLAFDGRFRTCYPQEVVDMYFDFAAGDKPAWARHRGIDSPPYDPARILHFTSPDLVLLDRTFLHAGSVMAEHREHWVVLYQDEVAQVWGRRDRYDNPHSPDYVPECRRMVSDAPQSGSARWPALPMYRHDPVGAFPLVSTP